MSEKEPEIEKWKIISEQFCFTISPAKDWESADEVASISAMAKHLKAAHPDIIFTLEDLVMALHSMNIPYERNENNQKYYYLINFNKGE